MFEPDQKLRLVVEGMSDESLISGLCERNHISEAELYDWRDTSLAGATQALTRDGNEGRLRNGTRGEPAHRG
jgi:hypothetical protein